ncbi:MULTISPECIES: hypothetical protein [unclassified Chelatococcus]|uniref:hypothetical protein n=1 Tax=unclassified Chelatococcus TaxID=2638111 RepID=UPI001BCF7192|nr:MULTISPECIES: hypothetical protein [unclassified Chelatococcus]MBS7697564.1 hypothetical protein [Chelatococcus sp. YT9]MBX3559361.1 hypothetical protein [Chelatococcus sp.]
MTIVALWYEQAEGLLWAAADTRISANSSTVTDSGSKILVLPVVCRQMLDYGLGKSPYRQTSIGFAFAGTVSPALYTHAIASTFLQSLISRGPDCKFPTPQVPFAIDDAASLCARIGTQFSKDYLSTTNGRLGWFEAAVFGWCWREQGFRVCHLTQPGRPSGDPTILVESIDPMKKRTPVILGQADEYNLHMEKFATNGDRHGRTSRVPILVIESAISRNTSLTVGGSISLATVAKEEGVNVLCRVSNSSVLEYNGVSLNGADGMVGQHFFIGMRGMA